MIRLLMGRLEKAHVVAEILSIAVQAWVAVAGERRQARDQEKDVAITALTARVQELEKRLEAKPRSRR
jgi:hypothetical protein